MGMCARCARNSYTPYSSLYRGYIKNTHTAHTLLAEEEGEG